MGNWQRQERLTAKQNEAEQAKKRAKIRAESRDVTPRGRGKRKWPRSKRQAEDVAAEADGWEDVDDEGGKRLAMNPRPQIEPAVDNEHATFGHTIVTMPSCSLPGQPLQAPDPSSFDEIAKPFTLHFPAPQDGQLQHPASENSNA